MVKTSTWPNSGGIGRRGLVFTTVVLLALIANTCGLGIEARHQTRRPNVVLVFADDLGIGDVGYNRLFAVGGAVHTPVLDQIAAQGTKLTRFYTNALCTPSRASLLTGRFASRTNMKNPDGYDIARSLNEEEQLLPEVLKDMGYQTHMVGKWHLGQHERKFTPLGRGFDTYCGNLGGAADNFHHNFAPPGPVTVGQYRPHDLHCGTKDDSNGQFSNRAPRLAATEKKRPATCDLLSGVNYNGHASTSSHRLEVDRAQPRAESTFPDEATYSEFYLANVYGQHSVEVIEAHDPGDGPLFLYTAFTAGHDPLQALSEDFEGCSPEAISSENRRVFCAMTHSLSRNTGYIVDALKRKGMWEDTVFIFASDNGGSAVVGGDNGPLRGGKGFLYDGGLRAPAFIHFGNNTVEDVSKTRGVERNEPIHLVDLFTTIVRAVSEDDDGFTFANDIDGRDIWTYISKGKPLPPSDASVNFNIAAGPGFMSATTRSLFNEDGSYVEAIIATYEGTEYKLCRNCAGFAGDEVFDLLMDPYEDRNLAGVPEFAKVEAFLSRELARWRGVSYPELEYPTLVERAAELLEDAGLDPDLADELVNTRRCYLPLDSPEFICSDCSQLALDFPLTSPSWHRMGSPSRFK